MPESNCNNGQLLVEGDVLQQVKDFFEDLAIADHDPALAHVNRISEINNLESLREWIDSFIANIGGFIFNLDALLPLDDLADNFEDAAPDIYEALRLLVEEVGSAEMLAAVDNWEEVMEPELPNNSELISLGNFQNGLGGIDSFADDSMYRY